MQLSYQLTFPDLILRGREEEELLLDGHPARLLVPAAAHDAVVDLGGVG